MSGQSLILLGCFIIGVGSLLRELPSLRARFGLGPAWTQTSFITKLMIFIAAGLLTALGWTSHQVPLVLVGLGTAGASCAFLTVVIALAREFAAPRRQQRSWRINRRWQRLVYALTAGIAASVSI